MGGTTPPAEELTPHSIQHFLPKYNQAPYPKSPNFTNSWGAIFLLLVQESIQEKKKKKRKKENRCKTKQSTLK